MKILIADKSKSIRLRLGFLLGEFVNIEIVEVESGQEALKILTGIEPPQIALLAWMINDLSGIEVCRRIHERSLEEGETKSPLYTILMSSKCEAEEIAEGLRAGADDFVQKPWNDVEFKARIEVAMRSVGSQMASRRRFTEIKNQLRRIEALGVKAKGRKSESRVSYMDEEKSPSRQPSLIAAPDGIIQVERHLVAAFSKFGCGDVLATDWDGSHPKREAHVAWSASILDDVDMWMDFLIQIDQRSLEFIHKAIHGHTTQNKYHLDDTLKEMVESTKNEIQTALKTHSLPAWSVDKPVILTPHFMDLPPINLEYAEQIQLQVGEAEVFITIMDEESPVLEVDLRELEKFQILVEDFYSPSKKETPIFEKGTSIRQTHLNILFDLSNDEERSFTLNVMKPSALGRLGQKVSSISSGAY